MTTLKFADTHNMVAFLSKPTESDGFEQIVDFLNAHPIRYALTINHTIYISCIKQFWSTAKAKSINGEVQIHARVDGKEIVTTEASVRRDLQLGDAEGIDCLPNSTIFKQLALMGKPKRKDTHVPQPSGPTKAVVDEAVHKELGDSLMRAATTASSLEAEHESGGGPMCQETMGDTTTQTRFESVSKHSNDSLLTKGNTLQSNEDRLKFNELMALCTNLQNKLLDLEKKKTTQSNEIASLKRRVKKLKKKSRKRTHKLKRLYKVGLTAKDLQERERERERAEKEQEANIALIETWDDIKAKINVVHQLAERLQAQEQEELAFRRVTTFEEFRPELVERKEKRAREELIQESTKKQKVKDDKEKIDLKQLMETIPDEEEVAIDAIPLAVKSPRIVDWKIHKEVKKSYYHIVRADGKSHMYMFFSQMLKSFDKKDLKDLYKLVKARYGSTRPVENMDYLLWSDMKLMFEPHVEDKKYPLTSPTLSMMLERKLQIDYVSEMAYQLPETNLQAGLVGQVGRGRATASHLTGSAPSQMNEIRENESSLSSARSDRASGCILSVWHVLA
nr:hypothetical protein [Tanacetum cinerariifolium]